MYNIIETHRGPVTYIWLSQLGDHEFPVIMPCHLFGTKPLSKLMWPYCYVDPWEQTSVKLEPKYHSSKFIRNCCLQNGGQFVSVSNCQFLMCHYALRNHVSHFEYCLRDSFALAWGLLTHWGRPTPICVGKLTIFGLDNGLSPGRRQAIIWTNVGILLIGPLRTNFSEILIGIQTFAFKKMHLKMSSAKWGPFVSASMC